MSLVKYIGAYLPYHTLRLSGAYPFHLFPTFICVGTFGNQSNSCCPNVRIWSLDIQAVYVKPSWTSMIGIWVLVKRRTCEKPNTLIKSFIQTCKERAQVIGDEGNYLTNNSLHVMGIPSRHWNKSLLTQRDSFSITFLTQHHLG